MGRHPAYLGGKIIAVNASAGKPGDRQGRGDTRRTLLRRTAISLFTGQAATGVLELAGYYHREWPFPGLTSTVEGVAITEQNCDGLGIIAELPGLRGAQAELWNGTNQC